MGDVADKLACFQAVTGIDDVDLCTEILAAHNWDLELAISLITSTDNSNNGVDYHRPSVSTATIPEDDGGGLILRPSNNNLQNPNLAWKLITLPFSIISASLGLVFGAIGLGMWVVGGALSFSLGLLGIHGSNRGRTPSSASQARQFVDEFEREYGGLGTRPNFIAEGFMDALQRSRREYKLMFVYLHSREHHDSETFCEGTLCDERLVAFLNENFVIWGGNVRSSEGFKMSHSLKASRYPFCAVVMAAANQQIAMLSQVEGPKSPEEMITILQRVQEESAPVLVSARLEAEERRNNLRLREEQDAAYRAALEADRARERQRKEEQSRLEREAAEVERKRKEEEEALERAALEAAEREASLAKIREQKALSLGAEPDKGPDVTQVLVRFPSGERKERRFPCTATVESLYDYVDSFDRLDINGYNLVSNFPRTVYGHDKLPLSLKEAGLHPQASLFVERN